MSDASQIRVGEDFLPRMTVTGVDGVAVSHLDKLSRNGNTIERLPQILAGVGTGQLRSSTEEQRDPHPAPLL